MSCKYFNFSPFLSDGYSLSNSLIISLNSVGFRAIKLVKELFPVNNKEVCQPNSTESGCGYCSFGYAFGYKGCSSSIYLPIQPEVIYSSESEADCHISIDLK